MWSLERHQSAVNTNSLVAAVFFDDQAARDAVADLKLAGYDADHVAVAASTPAGLAEGVNGKHSWRWKLRHHIEEDAHTRSPNVAPLDQKLVEGDAGFTAVDLDETLGAMGVAANTVQIVRDRMGAEGYFIMVDAGYDRAQVESILVKNRGMLRNEMASEATAAKLPADGRSTVHERVPLAGER